MIPIYVLTNDKHLWLLRGFSYLFNTFWNANQPVIVAGFHEPDFIMPPNFTFTSLGPANLPAEKWSNGLIQLLRSMPPNSSRRFLLLLEDFWLTAPVDIARLTTLYAWFTRQNSLCLDVSGTRGTKRGKVRSTEGGCLVIETPPGTAYQMSFQASFWDRDQMLKVLVENENPWQCEIDGSKRVDNFGLSVLGTRQALIKYQPVYRAKRDTLDVSRVPVVQAEYLKRKGCLVRSNSR